MSDIRTCQTCGRSLQPGEVNCPDCGVDRADTAEVAGRTSMWDEIRVRLAAAAAPKYEVQRLLGYGGMAGVYLAYEKSLDRQVAIKVMSPALMMDPRLVGRFRQEARTTAQLNHSNIVTIHDVVEEDGLFFYAMRYVAGRSLAEVMPELERPLEFEIIRHWLTGVGNALDYAHHAGVTHRDIKPSNILLNAQGDALVTDFGIAKVVDQPSLTQTGVLVGTPAYMSPEQCSSAEVGGASDQYSLGAVAYLLITGKPPFAGPTALVLQQQVNERAEPIEALRPDCPPELARAVERMLEKRPEDRFPDIAEAVEALGTTFLSRNHKLRGRMSDLSASVAEVRIEAGSDSVFTGESVDIAALVFDGTGRELHSRTMSWTTSDPSIAEVADGRLRAVGAGVVVVTARCQEIEASVSFEVVPIPVATVELEPLASAVHPGDAFELVASTKAADGELLTDRLIEWRSDDSSVAKVDEAGKLEARAPGSTVVSATSEGVTASIALNVTDRPVDHIAIEGAPSAVIIGEQFDLSATLTAANGKTLHGRPVTWRAGDDGVVSIDADGRAKAVGLGKTAIVAESGDTSAEVSVHVKAIPIGRVQISGAPPTLIQGETAALSVTLLSETGAPLEGRQPRWLSTRPEVATVDDQGLVTALASGSATITVQCEGVADSLVIQVDEVPVASLELSSPKAELVVGDQITIVATALGTRGEVLEDRPIQWSSGNVEVARVSASGVVDGLRPGVATITATAGRAAKSLVLKVMPVPVTLIELVRPSGDLERGDRVRLHATPRGPQGEELRGRELSWTSSDRQIAVVDQEGVVEAKAGGTATITVRCEYAEASIPLQIHDAAAEATRTFLPPEQHPPALGPGVDPPASATEVLPSPELHQDHDRTVVVPASGLGVPTREAAAPGGSQDTPTDSRDAPRKQAPARPGRERSMLIPALGIAGVGLVITVAVVALRGGDPSTTTPAAASTDLTAVVDSTDTATDPGTQTDADDPGQTASAGIPPGGDQEEPQQGDVAAEGAADGSTSTDQAAVASEETTQPTEVPAAPADGLVELAGALPDGGVVRVSGPDISPRGLTGTSIRLPPGTYSFEIEAPGFETRVSQVAVSPDGRHELPVDLTPLPPSEGTLRVAGNLPQGTVLTLSGNGLEPRNVTGGSVSLSPGTYRVEARAPGYQASTSSVRITSGQESVFSADLQPVPDTSPPEPDPAVVASELQTVFEMLAFRVESQDRSAASAEFPGAMSWFESIEILFNPDATHSVSVSVGTMGLPSISGSRATLNVDIGVTFQDIRNQSHNLPQQLVATFDQVGGAWTLSSLVSR